MRAPRLIAPEHYASILYKSKLFPLAVLVSIQLVYRCYHAWLNTKWTNETGPNMIARVPETFVLATYYVTPPSVQLSINCSSHLISIPLRYTRALSRSSSNTSNLLCRFTANKYKFPKVLAYILRHYHRPSRILQTLYSRQPRCRNVFKTGLCKRVQD